MRKRSIVRDVAVRVSINILAICAVLVIANIAFRLRFHDFYRRSQRLAINPGLNSHFVPQGCTYDVDDDLFITAGYRTDGGASGVYVTGPQLKKPVFHALTTQGEPFLGHTGGIQYVAGSCYIADEGVGVYRFPVERLLRDAAGTEPVEVGVPIPVSTHSSFVSAGNQCLYVGEFHRDGAYDCEHEISIDGMTHHAIAERLPLRADGSFGAPEAVYSLPDNVQGFVCRPDGSIVLSCSWGLAASRIMVYASGDIQRAGEYEGVPLYFLGKPTRSHVAPPMSEDIDVLPDGTLVMHSELASNKYILGKLVFLFWIRRYKV